MLPKDNDSELDWSHRLDEVLSLAQTDQFAAMAMAKSMLPAVEAEYGVVSKETMALYHQLGLLAMLLESYDEAELFLLKTMELGELLPDIAISGLADVTRHLTLLYEAKSRLLEKSD